MTRDRQVQFLMREASLAREQGDYLGAMRALEQAQILTEKDRRDRLEAVIEELKGKASLTVTTWPGAVESIAVFACCAFIAYMMLRGPR